MLWIMIGVAWISASVGFLLGWGMGALMAIHRFEEAEDLVNQSRRERE